MGNGSQTPLCQRRGLQLGTRENKGDCCQPWSPDLQPQRVRILLEGAQPFFLRLPSLEVSSFHPLPLGWTLSLRAPKQCAANTYPPRRWTEAEPFLLITWLSEVFVTVMESEHTSLLMLMSVCWGWGLKLLNWSGLVTKNDRIDSFYILI